MADSSWNVTAHYEDYASGVELTAEWNGGAYIDISFGGAPAPSEVINVWNYETGATTVERPEDVAAAVVAWVDEIAEEWPTWYEDYLENSRY